MDQAKGCLHIHNYLKCKFSYSKRFQAEICSKYEIRNLIEIVQSEHRLSPWKVWRCSSCVELLLCAVLNLLATTVKRFKPDVRGCVSAGYFLTVTSAEKNSLSLRQTSSVLHLSAHLWPNNQTAKQAAIVQEVMAIPWGYGYLSLRERNNLDLYRGSVAIVVRRKSQKRTPRPCFH